jgi:hypothetical protein
MKPSNWGHYFSGFFCFEKLLQLPITTVLLSWSVKSLRTNCDFCHQGSDTDISKWLKPIDMMTIHWKALEVHLLIMSLVSWLKYFAENMHFLNFSQNTVLRELSVIFTALGDTVSITLESLRCCLINCSARNIKCGASRAVNSFLWFILSKLKFTTEIWQKNVCLLISILLALLQANR